jgi:hypothetical protein
MPGLISTFLIVGVLSASDGGAVEDVLKQIGEALFKRLGADDSTRAQRLDAWKRMAATGSPAERSVSERALRLEQSKAPPEELFHEWTDLLRDVAKLARGKFTEEKAVVDAFAVLSQTALNIGEDPVPLRHEALTRARELVQRYPKEARAHASLAFALILEEDLAGSTSDAVLAELKRCVELDPNAWCRKKFVQIAAERERPRCSGSALIRPLTLTAASEPVGREPPPVEVDSWGGQKLALEEKPAFVSKDFVSIAVNDQGGLSLMMADPRRLEAETRRIQALPSGSMVLKLGDEVLLVARVVEAIPNGRVDVRQGSNKPAFRLEQLCRTVEHPQLPPDLQLHDSP